MKREQSGVELAPSAAPTARKCTRNPLSLFSEREVNCTCSALASKRTAVV